MHWLFLLVSLSLLSWSHGPLLAGGQVITYPLPVPNVTGSFQVWANAASTIPLLAVQVTLITNQLLFVTTTENLLTYGLLWTSLNGSFIRYEAFPYYDFEPLLCTGVAVDTVDNEIVLAFLNGFIAVANSTGVVLGTYSFPQQFPYGFTPTGGVAVDVGRRLGVAVLDDRLVIFSLVNYSYITDTTHTAPNVIITGSVAIDPIGHYTYAAPGLLLYVLDSQFRVVQNYSTDFFALVLPAGAPWVAHIGFSAVATDAQGHVYILQQYILYELTSPDLSFIAIYDLSPLPGEVPVNANDILDRSIIQLPSGASVLADNTPTVRFFTVPPPSVNKNSAAVSSSTGAGSGVNPAQSATFCFMFYALAGNVDYPWSSAISLQIQYSSTPITTAHGTAVSVVSGSGTRTYTNRFGASTTTNVTVTPAGTMGSDNLLYLGSSSPLDSLGLTLNLSSPVQLPGIGPNALFAELVLSNSSGFIVEGNSTRVDPAGSSFLSSVSGFVNVTISASNINSLAVQYSSCQALITCQSCNTARSTRSTALPSISTTQCDNDDDELL